MPTGNKGMINHISNMVVPQVCGDADWIDSTLKIVKSKRGIKEEKKSDYDKNFPPLKMMKTSTPTTKNNSKDDSSSRSSKSNNTNKTPTRKPSNKSRRVTPNVDKVKIVQVPKAFGKNDKDDMQTVSVGIIYYQLYIWAYNYIN